MISLYTTLFNISRLNVNFDDAFSNWLYYCDEIVISTFTKEVAEVKEEISKSKFYDSNKIKIVSKQLDIEKDVFWEGKLKNKGLQSCNNEVVIQCDLDERISGKPILFHYLCNHILSHASPRSIMLPTIDLYEDLDHYVNIGYKWYMHRKKGTHRGSVKWARKDNGDLDPEKSDTCELIDKDANLIPCLGKVDLEDDGPKIIHLGYLDLKERNNVNEFWGKIWNHRSEGEFDSSFTPEKVESGDPRKQKHNLSKPLWPKL